MPPGWFLNARQAAGLGFALGWCVRYERRRGLPGWITREPGQHMFPMPRRGASGRGWFPIGSPLVLRAPQSAASGVSAVGCLIVQALAPVFRLPRLLRACPSTALDERVVSLAYLLPHSRSSRAGAASVGGARNGRKGGG